MGYYPGWTDKALADIAAGNPNVNQNGAGVDGLRPALFEHFLEYYGYDIRVGEFQHYESLGIKNNTVFVGYPSEEHRDKTEFCGGKQTAVFANLYDPIWDDGENETPVNDDNYYALYLYKMVQKYGPFVKVWEIWNEPDFDFSATGWKPATFPESWWNEDPDPCDFALLAPPEYYVRMLRISWEVIKTIQPEAFVAVGGLGYPSFLDVILRKTDNPDGGKVTSEYPLSGGAYFDMLSYHSYPHIDGSLREWSNDIGGFINYRHSDAAVDGMLSQKDEFEKVLTKFGYDERKYPKKHWIITECTVPRKTFGDFMGSEEGQVNFLIKALTTCQANQIYQFHIYQIGELKKEEVANNEYQLMGLFKKLEGTPIYEQTITNGGIAYKTTSDLLKGYSFSQTKTNELQLSEGTKGFAFKNKQDQYRYVLWATTNKDRSEEAFGRYSFPTREKVKKMTTFKWNYSRTQRSQLVTGNEILLTGSPTFIDVNN